MSQTAVAPDPTIENTLPVKTLDDLGVGEPLDIADPAALTEPEPGTNSDPGAYPQPNYGPLSQPAAPSASAQFEPTGTDFEDSARSWLGVKYVYGGNGRGGIDCSGLTRAVYKQVFGIDLPRISYQQANGGKRVSFKDAKAGDLIAWDNSSRNNGADHIALYMGNGWIIESPRPGLKVRMRRLNMNGYDSGAWAVTYRK